MLQCYVDYYIAALPRLSHCQVCYNIILLLCSSGEMLPTNEHLALEALKNWEDVPGGYPLVPEHIESRSMYNPEQPGVQMVS